MQTHPPMQMYLMAVLLNILKFQHLSTYQPIYTVTGKKSWEITYAPNKLFTSIFTYCCEKNNEFNLLFSQ